MKKINKKFLIVVMLLCSVTVGLCFSLSEVKAEGKDNTTSSREVLISFENVKDTLSCMRFTDFNKGELCSGKQYITEGKSSLHLYTQGDASEPHTALVVFYPKKNSYLDTEYISLDIYSAAEEARDVVFGYADVYETYVLEPGENTLWFYIERSRLEYDSHGEISEFYLQFAPSKAGDKLDIYLDNLSSYVAPSEYEKYSNDFTEDVKYGFEKEAELANFVVEGSTFQKPQLSINHNFRYLKSGMSSLKVDFRSVEVTRFSLEDNKLGDFNQYLNELDKYKLCVPIYNPNNYDITCSMVIYSNYNNESVTLEGTIPANAWAESEFQVSLAELKEAFTGTGLDVKKIDFSFDGVVSEGTTVYIDSIGVYTEE